MYAFGNKISKVPKTGFKKQRIGVTALKSSKNSTMWLQDTEDAVYVLLLILQQVGLIPSWLQVTGILKAGLSSFAAAEQSEFRVKPQIYATAAYS